MLQKTDVEAQAKLLILDAVKLLEEKGWCTRNVQNWKGAMCIHGALNMADHGDAHWSMPRSERLTVATGLIGKVLQGQAGAYPTIFADWNNVQTSKEPVIAAMLEAVK